VSVALVIQLAKSIHSVVLSSVACLVLPYISKLSHKWQEFKKKVIENNICVLNFSTTLV